MVSSQQHGASQYGWWERLRGSGQCSFEERRFVWEEILTHLVARHRTSTWAKLKKRKERKCNMWLLFKQINNKAKGLYFSIYYHMLYWFFIYFFLVLVFWPPLFSVFTVLHFTLLCSICLPALHVVILPLNSNDLHPVFLFCFAFFCILSYTILTLDYLFFVTVL